MRVHANIGLGLAVAALTACAAAPKKVTTVETQAPIIVEAPSNNPAERDDPKAPIVRVSVVGSANHAVPVPYVYGYPLYADGAAIQGVRMLRQDNWVGYMRDQQTDGNGVVHVIESFPALGCSFEGIQEDDTHYVPFYVQCELPAPNERGKNRPAVGQLGFSAKAESVPREAGMAKAFLGEWHATTPGFDGNDGSGYFDTPHGLVSFGFTKGKLNRVAFVFDPAEKRWRTPELWQPPPGVAVMP